MKAISTTLDNICKEFKPEKHQKTQISTRALFLPSTLIQSQQTPRPKFLLTNLNVINASSFLPPTTIPKSHIQTYIIHRSNHRPSTSNPNFPSPAPVTEPFYPPGTRSLYYTVLARYSGVDERKRLVCLRCVRLCLLPRFQGLEVWDFGVRWECEQRILEEKGIESSYMRAFWSGGVFALCLRSWKLICRIL